MKQKIIRFTALVLTFVSLFALFPLSASALTVTSGEITANGVIMRKKASADSAEIAKLSKGTIVEILKTNVNAEWYQIKYDGKTGYVNRVYISWDRSLYKLTYTGTVVNVKEYANVRAEASTKSQLLGPAKKGETYRVITANAAPGWHKISYNGSEGYLNTKYVDLKIEASDTQLTSLNIIGGTMAPTSFSPYETGYMVTTKNASVTIKASANSGVRLTMNGLKGNSYTVSVPDGGMKTVRIALNGKVAYTVYIMRNVITVGTWNIKRGNGKLLEQGRLVRDQMPDIMGIQEVFRSTSGTVVDNLASLKTRNAPYTVFCATLKQKKGEYGHGILSRYKVLSQDTYALSSPGVEQRYLSRSVLNVNGQRVSFYNTHFSYDSSKLRSTQFAEVAAIMQKDTNKYKILTGDFNADYAEFAQLGDYKVVNTPSTKYFDYYGAPIQYNEIDNIIMTKNIKVVNTRIVVSNASDHCPVFAYLRLS